MTDVLAAVEGGAFLDFMKLFKPEEGRMGVTVTFVAILELMREGLLEIVQTEPYGPLHVRAAQGPHLRLVEGEPSESTTEAIDSTEADQSSEQEKDS